MIIRHKSPERGWVKVDRRVLQLDISDGAKVLYLFLCSLKNGTAYTDLVLCARLKCKQATLTNRKKELKKEGLLLVEQILPRVYVAYIGSTKENCNVVRAKWADEDLLPMELNKRMVERGVSDGEK